MNRIGRLLVGLLLVVITNSAIAEVFCVDTALVLQNALSKAASNGEDDQIQVVQGSYTGNFKYGSVEDKALAIQGGFTEGCASRKIDPTNTVLDGNQSGNVLLISVPNTSANVLINGLKIKNGMESQNEYGGGFNAKLGGNSSVTINASIFDNNSVSAQSDSFGGGVSITGSSKSLNITITNNIFQKNMTSIPYPNDSYYSSGGGGIYIAGSTGTVSVMENIIQGNSASSFYTHSYGGGVYIALLSGTVFFRDNIIQDNATSNTFGSSVYPTSLGGGVYVSTPKGTITFQKNKIQQNSASAPHSESSNGGGLYITTDSGLVTLYNNIIQANATSSTYGNADGGGVYITSKSDSSSMVNFLDNVIQNNSSTADHQNAYGGGVFVSAAVGKFTNNIIRANINNSYGGGGGISSAFQNILFINNSIEGNQSFTGGGIYLGLFGYETASDAKFINNIFWSNIADQAEDLYIQNDTDFDNIPSPVIFKSNNFAFNRWIGYSISSPVVIDSTNLSDVDPLFISEELGDLHLSSVSPMINAGYSFTTDLPDFDIEGTYRFIGESVDIGAYEFDDGGEPRGILSILKSGTGSGSIISTPSGINCGTTCDKAFLLSTEVMLSATPDTNSVFDGWSGNEDCQDGALVIDTHKQCTAGFKAVRQLKVTKAGSGKGNVTSVPLGIDCGASCNAFYGYGDSVKLVAIPEDYFIFSKWEGDADCIDGVVVMTENINCTAIFEQVFFSLNVLISGTGTGKVTTNLPGINCESDCNADYPSGTKMTLTALSNPGHHFSGWNGACTGTKSCELTMDADKTVGAKFDIDVSFADLLINSWAYGYIHAIGNAGITTGCGNNNYCPTSLVTRDQMAAFLVRAIEGDPQSNLCAAGSPFSDVPWNVWYCSHVKRLVDLAITGGCGQGKYCPGNLVTREQMAAFIVRAKEGEPPQNYCGGVAPFNDVSPSSWSCSYIKKLVELGITQGCGNGNYCPTASVTREQMAAFLARAFLGMD